MVGTVWVPTPPQPFVHRRYGYTALHWAALCGGLRSVHALINARASLNILSNYRWAFWCGRCGRVGQCRLRCRRCAQVHAAALCCRQWPHRRNGRADRRRRGRDHRGPIRVRCAAPRRTADHHSRSRDARRRTAKQLAQHWGKIAQYAAAVVRDGSSCHLSPTSHGLH